MKVFVTGAGGFVGAHVVGVLSDSKENEIIALLRKPGTVNKVPGVRYVVNDLSALEPLREVLTGVDVVIHAAGRAHILDDIAPDPLAEFRAINRDATLRLAKLAADCDVSRFIYFSSVKVLGESTAGNCVFTNRSQPNPRDPYAVSKHEAELGLRRLAVDAEMEVVIIRPPLVYGVGVKGNFEQLIKAVTRAIPLPLASVRNRRSMVSIDNLVDFVALCIEHPCAANRTFLVSDNDNLSTPQLITSLAEALGVRRRLFKVHPAILKWIFTLFRKQGMYDRLCGSMVVDIHDTMESLEWKPSQTVGEALANFKPIDTRISGGS